MNLKVNHYQTDVARQCLVGRKEVDKAVIDFETLILQHQLTNLAVTSLKLSPESKLIKFPTNGKLVKRGPGGMLLN